jgi:serine protease Do
MDLKLKKVIIILILTLVELNCQDLVKNQAITGDSSLVKSAYAQIDTTNSENTNENIYQSRQNAITRAVGQVSPAVVGITVTEIQRVVQRNPFMDDPYLRYFFPELFRDRVFERPVTNMGSGFVISPDGYILTNDHVAGKGDEIIVTLPGGERHKANLVGTDRVSDVTLLKIDGDKFPYLKMGNSDNLIVGEWVIAFGNPFGLFELSNQPTVTVGVISAINRNWGKIPESGRVYKDMIQTDAAINHGNSGGPLVNSLGQVIGMNTFIYTGSRYEQGFVGIGFAIPINRILKISEQIKASGGVNRNIWWGFKVQDLNEVIIRALGLKVKQGVIITQIDAGSSADKAGLRTEDVILRVGNQTITNTDAIVKILEDMDVQVGDDIEFYVVRDKKEQKINMKLLETR